MSPLHGVVGTSAYRKNDVYNTPIWKHTSSEFDVGKVSTLPRVDIMFACADMSPDRISSFFADGFRNSLFRERTVR